MQDEARPPANGGFDRWLGAGLALCALLLLLGWTLPVMTVETFYVFEDRVTIAGALAILFQERRTGNF